MGVDRDAVPVALPIDILGQQASTLALAPIPRFTLMTDGEDQNDVLIRLDAVEGDIAGLASRNHKFSEPMLDGTANQWMTFQHGNCFLDQPNRLRRGGRIDLDQEVGKSLEIGQRLFRVDQPRQDFAFGLPGFLPAMRA